MSAEDADAAQHDLAMRRHASADAAIKDAILMHVNSDVHDKIRALEARVAELTLLQKPEEPLYTPSSRTSAVAFGSIDLYTPKARYPASYWTGSGMTPAKCASCDGCFEHKDIQTCARCKRFHCEDCVGYMEQAFTCAQCR